MTFLLRVSRDSWHGFENPRQTCQVPGTEMAHVILRVYENVRSVDSYSYVFMHMCVCYFEFLSKTKACDYYDVSETRKKAFSEGVIDNSPNAHAR